MNMKWLLIEIAETVEELKAIMHSQSKQNPKSGFRLYIYGRRVLLKI